MNNLLRTSNARTELPPRSQDNGAQTVEFAGRLADRAERVGRRLEWIHGTLAVMTLVCLLGIWTWVIVQMVQTWAEPLHQAREQLLANSSPH
jgi:hypothetical protein